MLVITGRSWVLTLLATLLSFGHIHSQTKTHQVIAIAFYNFENLFDTEDDLSNWGDNDFLPSGSYRYTYEIYQQKLHNLATVLSQIGNDLTPDGPAIIGTAEIENDKVLQDLCQQPLIQQRAYKYIHFDSRDSRGIDVALLYNPKYFRVIATRTLSVNTGEGFEKSSRTRDILHVTGILVTDTVHVFVNHWPSRRGGEAASAHSRITAAGVCRRAIDSLTTINPSTRFILMGDLNDDPQNASVTTTLGATGDKVHLSSTGIYNPFLSFYKKGYGTLSYNDSWNLFDQIMVSVSLVGRDDNHWRYYKAEVFNKPFLKYKFGQYKGYPLRSFEGHNWMNGYSDHFPSLIYLVKIVN